MNDLAFKNGPTLWKQLIAITENVLKAPAIVAGGAVRDYKLGLEPKDIDIFVPVKIELDLEFAIPEFKKHDLELSVFMPDTEIKDGYFLDQEEVDDGLFQAEVKGVLDGTFGPLKVQIIARPCDPFTGETVVSKFDLSICQAWYDGDVHYSNACTESFQTKEVKLLRRDTRARMKRSRERFDRFNKRAGGEFKWDGADQKKAVVKKGSSWGTALYTVRDDYLALNVDDLRIDW